MSLAGELAIAEHELAYMSARLAALRGVTPINAEAQRGLAEERAALARVCGRARAEVARLRAVRGRRALPG